MKRETIEAMNTCNDIYLKRNSMAKMLKLLGAAFLILHCSLFISCSDDLSEETAKVGAADLTRAYSAEQIKLQRLGYGYNAAGNVMDDSSFSTKPVINMDLIYAAEKSYGPIVSSERRHYTSMDIFSGSTLQELGHAETKYTIDDSEAIGSGKYYRNSKTFDTIKFHNSYKAHMFIKHVMATKTIDVGMMRCLKLDDLEHSDNILDAEFRKALTELVKGGASAVDTVKAAKFSEKYGTHLVVSSNLGGMIELQMQINRDSCVDREYTTQQVSEVVLGKMVTKNNPSKMIKQMSTHSIQYEGQIKVKGGSSEYDKILHKTFDEKRAAEVKIADGDYYGWAGSISITPDNYNASFVSGRFVPLYELFEDNDTRRVLRKVYEMYLKKEAPLPEILEPAYGSLTVKGNYGPDVRVARMGNNKSAILCQEYVPSIRSDKPCIVAYPLLRDIKNKERPFLYSGLFIGDESHRPGRVIWEGSSSVYIPSDSIFAESDSAAIRDLFDPQTHALRKVYFYWNAVHPQPCPTKKGLVPEYTTTIFKAQPTPLAESTTFAKVASTFWSVRPVVLKTDDNSGIAKYWNDDKDFKVFKSDRYNTNGGVMYKDNQYHYCLLDGGDNMQKAPQQTDDRYANKRWTAAVSLSMNALGLSGYLPSVERSKSITKMLGNRMSIFYSHEYDDHRNMLGLDWPTGYYVISHPSQDDAASPEKNDGQGMPIVTDDVGQVTILRLSGSGTDLLLEYPNYVRAFNYSDQMYFKFFPIYITIDNF